MKIRHIISAALLPCLALAGQAHAGCTGQANASDWWGQAYFQSTDGYTISGYTKDTSSNGNCVKLKQGVYSQINGTRTCTGYNNYFNNAAMPNNMNFLGIYLYEENSNRTAMAYGGSSCSY